MSNKIQPPRWDMMFSFDYAFSIAYDLIKNIPNVLGHYRLTAFHLDQGNKIYDILYIKGDNLLLYIQYEYIGQQIFTLVNPPSEQFQKWIEVNHIRLVSSDAVRTTDLGKISKAYYTMLNAYELAVHNGVLKWAYVEALTH